MWSSSDSSSSYALYTTSGMSSESWSEGGSLYPLSFDDVVESEDSLFPSDPPVDFSSSSPPDTVLRWSVASADEIVWILSDSTSSNSSSALLNVSSRSDICASYSGCSCEDFFYFVIVGCLSVINHLVDFVLTSLLILLLL